MINDQVIRPQSRVRVTVQRKGMEYQFKGTFLGEGPNGQARVQADEPSGKKKDNRPRLYSFDNLKLIKQ